MAISGKYQRVDFDQAASTPGGAMRLTTVSARAFVPNPLPPAIDLGDLLARVHEPWAEAERALSLLEGAASRLENPYVLIGPFMRREAILSSAIENTVATQEQLALFEVDIHDAREGTDDVREVSNYVRALEHGLKSELPISLRLIRQLHSILLSEVRGEDQRPGEFRAIQVYVGSRDKGVEAARFIPPPPTELQACLREFEVFVNKESSLPRLIRLAMAHYQFEAIHPFRDGNGRVGRLLIALELCRSAQLSKPFVYVSGYFDRHRDSYYDLLQRVSTDSDWFSWIAFFLRALAVQARDVHRRTARLLELQEQFHATVRTPRASALLPAVVDYLFERPVLTARLVSEKTRTTPATAMKLLRRLEADGIVTELAGRTYRRAWVARGIIDAIDEDYELDEPAGPPHRG